MQPAVETTAASTPLLTLGWMLLLGLLAIGVALAWLARRVALAPALGHWVRWLNLLVVAVWFGGVMLLVTLLLAGTTLTQALGRIAMLSIVGVLAAPMLRDLASGAVIGLEGRHRLGDDIRVLGLEGRIVSLGLRSVVIRGRDGSQSTIPNGRFASADVMRLNLASGEAPFELEVVLHRPGGAEAAMIELMEAAVLSPLAAPGLLPEVFLLEADGPRLRLRMRVYVFDRAYEERYRSDIISRCSSGEPSPSQRLVEPQGVTERG